MKHTVLLLMVLALANGGCQDESTADMGDATVFKRYFGSEYSHLPQQVLETSDGFLILCNLEIPSATNQGDDRYRIKLIKTDLQGNQQWSEVYPAFAEGDAVSLRASSMIVTNSGYVIMGEEINEEVVPKTQAVAIIKTNVLGVEQSSTTINAADVGLAPSSSLSGQAIALQNDAYIILATIANNGTDNTLFGSIDTTDYSFNWSQKVGAGGTTGITHQVFYDTPQNIVWAFSTSDIELTSFQENNLASDFSQRNTVAAGDEVVNAMCKTKGGFAGYTVIGTSNAGLTEDVYIVKFRQSGDSPVYFTKSIDFGANDKGISIAATAEGGTIALGTVESNADRGFGLTDILAVRLDTQGEILWQRNFGGSQNDEAASVIQTKDGGFLILGSTDFGTNFKKVTLLKVNAQGELK
jgi:hypothetical protein